MTRYVIFREILKQVVLMTSYIRRSDNKPNAPVGCSAFFNQSELMLQCLNTWESLHRVSLSGRNLGFTAS
jgi:hypothetical protein